MATQAELNPDAFVGRVTLNAYEPYQVFSGSQYSSFAPASVAVVHWDQPCAVAVKNIVLHNSLNAAVPAATSAASAGSLAHSYAYSAFLYSRQNYGAGSTNLSPVYSASFGLSASLSYTSTAQTFGMSWVTDTSGGAANLTTTSNAGNWSNYATGPKVFNLPFVTVLPAGEYWMAFQHSSSSATSNSNLTLLSMSQFQVVGQQVVTGGALGQSTGTVLGINQNVGSIGGNPVFSTTMALSTIGSGGRPIWFALSNA